VPGYYIGPALLHYRSHHVLATATSAPRITDNVAWLPETDVTPPLPDTKEILLAAIKDLSHAIHRYNLTGEVLLPTLAKDLEDLASLHYVSSPSSFSPPRSTAPAVPLPANDIVHDRRLTFPVSVGGGTTRIRPRTKGGGTTRIRSTTKGGINRYRARTTDGATVFGHQQPNIHHPYYAIT
jgi:hypothetical protein